VLFHGGSHVDRVRNELSARAMATGADYLLWIDSDVGGGITQFVKRAFGRRYKFAAAAYPTKEDNGRLNVSCLPGETTGDDGYLSVMETGGGCMLIHRSVFTELQTAERRYGGHDNTPIDGPLYDYWSSGIQMDGDGQRRFISEDYAFCRAARRAGFEIMLDTTVKLCHTGEKTSASV
jgi:hypothetical protein